jgi:hypothetical protein
MKSSAEEVKKELKTDTINQTKLFYHLYQKQQFQKNNMNDNQNFFHKNLSRLKVIQISFQV